MDGTAAARDEVRTGGLRGLERLRAIAGCSMLGCVLAGALGFAGTDVQWAAIVAGSWAGGMLR